jgi:hypothetical protein
MLGFGFNRVKFVVAELSLAMLSPSSELKFRFVQFIIDSYRIFLLEL